MQHSNDDNGLRAWLLNVLEATKLKPTPLAKEAGLAPSTIIRALDPDNPGELSIRTIRKIVGRFGVAPPSGFGIFPTANTPGGFAEPEALKIEENGQSLGILKPGDNQVVWQLSSRALDLAGYLPGDYVLIDLGVQPESGDVVCAQVYDTHQGDAETVFRIYDRPYLITETADPQSRRKPLLIDGERVVVKGTVVRALRQREAS